MTLSQNFVVPRKKKGTFVVSAMDERYLNCRRSLGNVLESFTLVSFFPEDSLASQFGITEAVPERLHFVQKKDLSLEENLAHLFTRVEGLFQQEIYGKVAVLLHEALEKTKKLPPHALVEQEKLFMYRAFACFHLGMLSSIIGESPEQGMFYLSQALDLNKELVRIAPQERYVGQMLRCHLELGKLYAQYDAFSALEVVGVILALSNHYVDILSPSSYASFREEAGTLGLLLTKD